MPRHQWQPGESGNPHGRPPKQRALTEILQKAGAHTVEIDGKRISGRRLVARMVWEGLTTSYVSFPGGVKLQLSPADWKDLVKWMYMHVDGPAKTEMDVTSGGERLDIVYVNDWRNNSTLPAQGTDSSTE